MILPDAIPANSDNGTATLSVADIAALLEKAQLADELAQTVALKSDVIASLQQRVQFLEEALRLAKIKRFAPSSEQSQQLSLFDEAETLAAVTDGSAQAGMPLPADMALTSELETSGPVKTKTKPGRKPFSDKLPREQLFIRLTDEEKAGAIDTFFTKVKEELDIIPAQVRILEYMQEKAVFLEPAIDGAPARKMVAAAMPKHPIPGAMGSIALMVFVLVGKYADGLPLYRQENILARYGGDITRTTLANWIIALASVLQPLINLIREHQLSGHIIMADETRVQVLKEPGHPATSNKYMWVTLGGPPGQPSVLFEYDPSRGGEVPLRLFDGFKGYLQTDGYAAYNAVVDANAIIHLGCWDHGRRKVKEAIDAQPKPKKGKTAKPSKAGHMLCFINHLYKIERQIKDLGPEEKYQQRQQRSLPVLNKLKAYLDDNRHKVPKDSLTGKAMAYLCNQWDKLTVYCSHGGLSISNVLAENAIRPFVIGRKAWLFSDTPKGAKASAIHYSLIETAKANGLDPYAYMLQVLQAIPYADTVEKLEALLPWHIKNSR